MNKFFTCLTITVLVQFVSISLYAQQNALIVTKRDATIGVVSFGSSVESNVLGGGNYVDGYVRRTGGETFVFPVGDNGQLRPFSASGDVTGAYYGVDPSVAVTSNPTGGDYGVLPAGGPFNAALIDGSLSNVSRKEYWDINGGSPTRLTITWNAASDVSGLLGNSDISKLTIVGWDGSKWVKIPSKADATSILGGTSNKTAGSLTSDASFAPDNYQVYSLGVNKDGALPVTLVSFRVRAVESQAALEWVTSSEINSSHFDIQRSRDGKSWASIGRQEAGNDPLLSSANTASYYFTDAAPLPGTNLYRLRMVDHDSTFSYSSIREVKFDAPAVAVYPNPVSDKMFLTGIEPAQYREIQVLDLYGKIFYKGKLDADNGVDVSRLAQQLYVVNVSLTDGSSHHLKVYIRR
jgi:hypothetical protein